MEDPKKQSMLERAKARQKKLKEHYNNINKTFKMPLQEANIILKKYENSVGLTKSQPNFTECPKINRKEVVSDTCLNTKSLYYDSASKENFFDSNLSKKGCTRVLSDLNSSPKSPMKILNIQKENFNMEISIDNVRVEVEIEERDDSDFNDNANDNQDDMPVIRTDLKNRLQRLGKLYSGVDEVQLSSPISRNESKFCTEDSPEKNKDVKKPSTGMLQRLKALSNKINQWEDEVTTSSVKVVKDAPKNIWKPPAPKLPATTQSFTHSLHKGPASQPPKNLESAKVNTTKVSSRESSSEKGPLSSPKKNNFSDGDSKKISWDKSVLASLESQGFTRTNSSSKFVYNYKKHDEMTDDKELEDVEEEKEIQTEEPPKIAKIPAKFDDEKKVVPKSRSKSNLRCGNVMHKAAIFEQNQSPTKTKYPPLMSVSERKALFEKNKGAALIPKAAFGMAAPVKNPEKETPSSKSKPASSKIYTSASLKKSTSALPKAASPSKSPDKKSVLSPTKVFTAESGGIASKMKELLEKKTTISHSQIANKIQEQRQKDLDMLLNRFNKNKDIS